MQPVATRTDAKSLYAATQAKDEKAVTACLASGACDLEYRTPKDQWTALIRASYDGNESIVKLLLENKADPDAASSLGRTAMHVAAHANHAPIVRLLLSAEADSDLLDIYDRSPLDYAKSYGEETEVIKMLKDAAAGILPGNLKVKKRHRRAFVAIEMAAEMKSQITGRHAALRRLVASTGMWEGDAKGDVDEDLARELSGLEASERPQGSPSKTAATFAAAFGKIKALRALVNADASTANGIQDRVGGNTPLHWAVLHRRLDSVEVLVSVGADPTRRNRDGRSALDIAREENFTEAVKLMEATPKGRIDAEARAAEDAAAREAEQVLEARAAARRSIQLKIQEQNTPW